MLHLRQIIDDLRSPCVRSPRGDRVGVVQRNHSNSGEPHWKHEFELRILKPEDGNFIVMHLEASRQFAGDPRDALGGKALRLALLCQLSESNCRRRQEESPEGYCRTGVNVPSSSVEIDVTKVTSA